MDRLDPPRQRSSAYGPDEPREEPAGYAESMLRWYSDLGRLWMDCLTAYVPGSEGIRSGRSGADSALSVDVTANRPVRATLELSEAIGERVLEASDLHTSDSHQPPLRDVVFHPGDVDSAPCLWVHVPDDHPPGTYFGAIVDRTSGREVGRISVRISPESDEAH